MWWLLPVLCGVALASRFVENPRIVHNADGCADATGRALVQCTFSARTNHIPILMVDTNLTVTGGTFVLERPERSPSSAATDTGLAGRLSQPCATFFNFWPTVAGAKPDNVYYLRTPRAAFEPTALGGIFYTPKVYVPEPPYDVVLANLVATPGSTIRGTLLWPTGSAKSDAFTASMCCGSECAQQQQQQHDEL